MELKILSDKPANIYHREDYVWLKEHGICQRCRKEDVYSETLCLSCLMDERERSKKQRAKFTDEQRAKDNRYHKRRQDLCIAFGVCVSCQKRDVSPGKRMCPICLAKVRLRSEKRRREKGILPKGDTYIGLCSFCNKEKPVEGKKLCPECYERSRNAMLYARSFLNNENHIWRDYSNSDVERIKSWRIEQLKQEDKTE